MNILVKDILGSGLRIFWGNPIRVIMKSAQRVNILYFTKCVVLRAYLRSDVTQEFFHHKVIQFSNLFCNK